MSLIAVTIGPAEMAFLRRLAEYDGRCNRQQLAFVDRKEDRARQTCRRHGLAEYSRGYWVLTDAGRDVLAREKRGGEA